MAGGGGATSSSARRRRSPTRRRRRDLPVVPAPCRGRSFRASIEGPLAASTRCAQEHGVELVRLADGAEAHACDLVVALGGDGTTLGALRAAGPANAPVLSVACGSLGVLAGVSAEHTADALERAFAGDWTPRRLPALAISVPGAADDWAVNDLVVVRRGAGQLVAAVTVDGEPYVRLAGDGVVVATALGSSAYSMAAGGPVLAAGTPAFVCTPLAAHGGSAPPLVVPAEATVTVDVQPGSSGVEVEIDGRGRMPQSHHFRLTLQPDKATLVTFGPTGAGLAGLRRRRLIADSPRASRAYRTIAPCD